ncbi:hypothetical protein MM236_07930 [Belliella sp. DSM 107340]|uniref:Uncharacterized protein n=1 Tax=Belliella calami TaxID=2923436 RepID=A0ABS9UNS1_9BACT|nr:hypothetical protein [Belliella calami]MCH7397913.1 hypothetical protein [Belliella calami]
MKKIKMVMAICAFLIASISITQAGDTFIDAGSGDIYVVSTYVDDYACAGSAGDCTRRVSYGY